MRNKLVCVEVRIKLIARAPSWQKSTFWHLAHEIEKRHRTARAIFFSKKYANISGIPQKVPVKPVKPVISEN